MDKRVFVILKLKFAEAHDGPRGTVVDFACVASARSPHLQRGDRVCVFSARIVAHRLIPEIVCIRLAVFGARRCGTEGVDLGHFFVSLRYFRSELFRDAGLLAPVFERVQRQNLLWFAADTTLDPIRDDPRYKAMLAQAEARLAATEDAP